jgi:hypothetical protein
MKAWDIVAPLGGEILKLLMEVEAVRAGLKEQTLKVEEQERKARRDQAEEKGLVRERAREKQKRIREEQRLIRENLREAEMYKQGDQDQVLKRRTGKARDRKGKKRLN